MDNKDTTFKKYLKPASDDEAWGIVVTTVGYQNIIPHAPYPSSTHPHEYSFKENGKRELDEYQLIYITKGRGYFTSKYHKKTLVEAGTIILLFPGVWHQYCPESETGWDEYWVGFKGFHIDNRVKSGFFTPQNCIFKIGIDDRIIDNYENIIKYINKERAGLQQLVSSIVLPMLGIIHYSDLNKTVSVNPNVEVINKAKVMLKENIDNGMSLYDISAELGLSYSLFRKEFKRQCGVSPGQYQQNIRLKRAKKLLSNTNKTVSDIAFELNFECTGQFSTFFHKREGITPLKFRQQFNSMALSI